MSKNRGTFFPSPFRDVFVQSAATTWYFESTNWNAARKQNKKLRSFRSHVSDFHIALFVVVVVAVVELVGCLRPERDKPTKPVSKNESA